MSEEYEEDFEEKEEEIDGDFLLVRLKGKKGEYRPHKIFWRTKKEDEK